MKRVLFRGPLLTESGYGVHARSIARWLLSRPDLDVKFNLTPWGSTSWILDRSAHNGLIGQIMERSVDGNHQADVIIMLQLPNEWQPTAPVSVGITAGIETDICNPQWLHYVNRVSRVIVPSTHVKSVFEKTSQQSMVPLTTRIDVVPESFPDACLLPKEEITPLQLNLTTKFNFLIFGQLTGRDVVSDRKNTFNALRWLCDEFKNDKDVGILLKTNSGTNSAFDKQQTTMIVKKTLTEVRSGEFPKIHLLHGSMTDEEVIGLYRLPSLKALISPTRGEGFGLPILEAAACGLPVIATKWSGHLDYMNKGRFISFEHKLAPVHPSKIDGSIFVNGAMWAEVDEQDFRRKVRRFYTSSVTPKLWASDLSKVLSKTHSFEAICSQYDATLSDVL